MMILTQAICEEKDETYVMATGYDRRRLDSGHFIDYLRVQLIAFLLPQFSELAATTDSIINIKKCSKW